MATRRTSPQKSTPASLLEDVGKAVTDAAVDTSEMVEALIATSLEPDATGDESPFEGATSGSADSSPDAAEPENRHSTRFHFFIIDAGWKSTAAKVLRENFGMIREFQNSDPLYVLNREQSIALIRANPDLIGKDPIVLVHDLYAKGGRGESGYHGFRLCLGLINDGQQALAAMQKFLRFVHQHRFSENIEKDIRDKLHSKGVESAIEVIRESMAA